MTAIILDQIVALKRKFLDLKTGQRSSCIQRRFPNKRNEIYFYTRPTQTTTAAILHSFFDLNRALEVGTNKGLHRAVMNTDELGKNLT